MSESSSTVTAYWAFRQMALEHENNGRMDAAFSCLEAAHIIGQRRTALHVAAHVAMLRLAWRQRHAQEIVGQSLRVAAALLFTWIWVPVGNTGRANVSAFSEMALPDDLRDLLSRDRNAT